MAENISPDEFNKLLNYYLRHPEEFAVDVFDVLPWSIQTQIIQSVFENKYTAVKTCNAIGKSFVAAIIVVTFLMLYPRSIVVTTAPTWRQVTDVLWREVATLVKRAKYKLTEAEVRQAGLSVDTDWFAVGLSTSRPENFFGYHADHILVVVDEAGGVDEDVFRGVAAITPNLNARVLLIGNPTNPSGTFFDAFVKKELGYKCFTVSAFDTPNFTDAGITTLEQLIALFTPPAGTEQNEWTKHVNKKLESYMTKYTQGPRKGDNVYGSLISPSVVYARYYEWGVDDPRWDSLIMGHFPSQATAALIPTDLLWVAMRFYERDKETGKTYGDLMGWTVRDGLPRAGQDMARFGGDRNVYTPRRGGIVNKQAIWNKVDLMTSADRIIDYSDTTDPLFRLNIDDTGNGGGTTDRLHQIDNEKRVAGNAGHVFRLVPYNMSSKERMAEPMRFHDLNSELWWNLRSWFISKSIAFEKFDQELYDELTDRRWWINRSGKIQVESKEEFKNRVAGRRSPDKADSLVLSFAGEKPNGQMHDVKTSQDKYYEQRQKELAQPSTAGMRDRRY